MKIGFILERENRFWDPEAARGGRDCEADTGVEWE